jgi:hypothetical protein
MLPFVPRDALPAVVVGRRLPRDASFRAVGVSSHGLRRWQHQYGGLACLQAQLVGFILPLSSVPGPRAEHATVLEGLAALGSDGRDGLAASFPELAALHLTHGVKLGPAQIDVLAAFLSRGLELPRPARGHEALVELARCDLVTAFGGWPLRQPAGAAHHGTFDTACLETLTEWLRHALPEAAPPKAYLVWNNSD